MSVLFPKMNQPREWDYRPIYFDKDEEARKDKRLARLHQGSLREEHEQHMAQIRKKQRNKMWFFIGLLIAFGVAYVILSYII